MSKVPRKKPEAGLGEGRLLLVPAYPCDYHICHV
jgi:hypothetical protein